MPWTTATTTATTTTTATRAPRRRPRRRRRRRGGGGGGGGTVTRATPPTRRSDNVSDDAVVVEDVVDGVVDALAPRDVDGGAAGRETMVGVPTTTTTTTTTRGATTEGRFGCWNATATCAALAAACAFAALEVDRRKRVSARERGIDPDADTHAALNELVRVAEELFERAPSERNAKKVNEARAALRDVETRQRERIEARRRAEEWKTRVRVKGNGADEGLTIDDAAAQGKIGIGGDAREERLRVEAILRAKRREREAEAKKPPLAGSSMEWMRADEYLNRVLEEESTNHVEDENVTSLTPDDDVMSPEEVARSRAKDEDETFEEYPPELIEAMQRMEADVATGTYTEEALYGKYKDVLDTFGEEFEPTTNVDDDDGDEHPQLLDPWWWRKARALFLIIVTPRPNAPEEFFAMQMVPDNIPERARPEDKYHLVAFENRRDAENFCFLMQSQRPRGEMDVELKGIVSMKAVGPKELQQLADSVDYGVTVVGAGRVDLTPNRPYVDVLNHIAHIGGEAYLWTFARDVKRNFDDTQDVGQGGDSTAPR